MTSQSCLFYTYNKHINYDRIVNNYKFGFLFEKIREKGGIIRTYFIQNVLHQKFHLKHDKSCQILLKQAFCKYPQVNSIKLNYNQKSINFDITDKTVLKQFSNGLIPNFGILCSFNKILNDGSFLFNTLLYKTLNKELEM